MGGVNPEIAAARREAQGYQQQSQLTSASFKQGGHVGGLGSFGGNLPPPAEFGMGRKK